MIYSGFVAFVLAFYGFFYTLPLLIFTLIAIPRMQKILNEESEKYKFRKSNDHFNTAGRSTGY